jgi:hypothetical protein
MKKPALVALALSLLVPILVLLIIGINSLRQDRIQAHQEATERAQQLADSLAVSGFAMLTHVDRQTDFRFTVDASGKLLSPPPLTPLAPTLLRATELTPDLHDHRRGLVYMRRSDRGQRHDRQKQTGLQRL